MIQLLNILKAMIGQNDIEKVILDFIVVNYLYLK